MATDHSDLQAAVRAASRAWSPRRSTPMTPLEIRDAIKRANQAADYAYCVRRKHRRRQRLDRSADIAGALAGLRRAMVPLRAEIARLAHDPGREARFGERLRRASRRIQRERKALNKMKPDA